MQFDILDRVTPQLTTIICHHMKKKNVIIKNIKTRMLTKTIHR